MYRMEKTREKIRKFFGNRTVPKTKELLLDLADVASSLVTLVTVIPHEYSALRYQAALAKKMKTKQSAIARLESGNYNPTLLFLAKVAKALDARVKIFLS